MFKTFTDYSFQHFSKNLPILLILFSNQYLLFPFDLLFWVHDNIQPDPGKLGDFVIDTLYSINVSDTSKMVNESHPYLFKLTHLTFHCFPMIMILNSH